MNKAHEIRSSEWYRRWKSRQKKDLLYTLKTTLKPKDKHPRVKELFDFRGVSLRKESFNGINLTNSDISESDLSHGIFSSSKLDKCNIISANFEKSRFQKSNFSESTINNSRFLDCNLSGSDFSNSNIHGSDFRLADIRDCNFNNCNLTNIDFRFAKNIESVLGIPNNISGLRIFYKDLKLLRKTEFAQHLNNGDVNIEYEYDIAISFAGEDRMFAEKIAENLRKKNIDVFFDEYEESDLWGKNLYDHLSEVYRFKAKFSLMVISKYYIDKNWTNLERKAMQARAFEENSEYILPLKLDDSEIPGILPTIGYLSAKHKTIKEISDLIIKKLKNN